MPLASTSASQQQSKDKSQTLSLALPITTHYKVNNRNLILFRESYKRGFNAIAYQYGKQFVETAIFHLPKHGYFNSGRHVRERNKCSFEALEVAQILEHMLGDDDCGGRHKFSGGKRNDFKDKKRINRNQESCPNIGLTPKQKKKERIQVKEYRNLIANVYSKKEKVDSTNRSRNNMKQKPTVIEKAVKGDDQKWSDWIEVWNDNTLNDSSSEISQSLVDKSKSEQSTNFSTPIKTDDQSNQISECLPPPPPLQRSTAATFQTFIQAPINLTQVQKSQPSPLQSPTTDFAQSSQSTNHTKEETPRNNPQTTIPISSLIQCYLEDFDHLLNLGKVTIHHLKTGQGKNNFDGINGCTVIAPLIAMCHCMDRSDKLSLDSFSTLEKLQVLQIKENYGTLNSHEDYVVVSPDLSRPQSKTFSTENLSSSSSNLSQISNNDILSDIIIEDIIDIHAPKILPIVRKELGLTKDALIIPADVHDFLIERSFLQPMQLKEVCGGDILKEIHVNAFLESLNSAEVNETKQTSVKNAESPDEKKKGRKEKNSKRNPMAFLLGGRGNFNKGQKKVVIDSKKNGTLTHKRENREKKTCATLFFHGHVICILKYKGWKEGEYSYEIIDSLPNISTLGCCIDNNETGGKSIEEQIKNHSHKPLETNSMATTDSNSLKEVNAIPLDSFIYNHYSSLSVKDAQQKADARMAQKIQQEEEEGIRKMFLNEDLALVYTMDENEAVAWAAAISAEEAEKRAREMAIAVQMEEHLLSGGTIDNNSYHSNNNAQSDNPGFGTYENNDCSKSWPVFKDAVRIKCKDMQSLEATLRWYCCSKFTDENIKFIDKYKWDDRNIEFDPRVFQAFIWTEL